MTLSKNILYFEAELSKTIDPHKGTPLTDENRKLIETVVANLQNKYGYSTFGAISSLKFIIKDLPAKPHPRPL